jgi:adenylate cyclase
MPMFVQPGCHGKPAQGCQSDLNPIGFTGYQHYFLKDQADKVPLQWTPQGATLGPAWTQPLWVDDNGFAVINYLGQPGDFEKHRQYLSFSDVVKGNFQGDMVKDKVVLVGAYHATGLHDEQVVPTSAGNQFMQGVELHANLVSMLQNQLNGSFLQPEPVLLVLLTMLVLGVGMGWLVAKLSVIRGGILVIGVLGIYTVFWAWGMQGLRMVPDLFHVWAVVFLAYTGVTAYRFLYEDREKRKVTAIFGQYLKPELVAQLAGARTLEELTLGGERRDLSLLFCDIRGFTSMSETMAAEDVVKVATEYLTDLTRTIFKWDGTIDKYVGDEIVAVWNAPHAQPNHALWAIRCAYDMISRAPEMQARLIAMNLPPIRYGIGINTGPAVWGNLGSPMRRQFTALGDTVNTAARFCGAAGAFELFIGEATYEQAKDCIAVELAPEIQLKGKSAETFKIYRVVAIREAPGAPWVPFPTDMAKEVTTQHTIQYRTQQTMMAAGATVSAEAYATPSTVAAGAADAPTIVVEAPSAESAQPSENGQG